jgi:hypothetical protein
MPSIIACPSCAGQLRLPEGLIGQEVCCPTCGKTFTAAAPPAPPPEPLAFSLPPLDLSLDDPRHGEPAPAGGKPRGLTGAVEVKQSPGDNGPIDEALPAAPRPLPRPPERDRPRDWDRDRDYDDDRDRFQQPYRRDREKGRGVAILVLGIVSLLCLTTSIYPLGIIFGLIAWVMGHTDLKRIRADEIDPEASGLTKGGWICGIIGTCVNGLLTLGCAGLICFLLLDNSSRPATTYKQQIQFKDGGKDVQPVDGDVQDKPPPPRRRIRDKVG